MLNGLSGKRKSLTILRSLSSSRNSVKWEPTMRTSSAGCWILFLLCCGLATGTAHADGCHKATTRSEGKNRSYILWLWGAFQGLQLNVAPTITSPANLSIPRARNRLLRWDGSLTASSSWVPEKASRLHPYTRLAFLQKNFSSASAPFSEK